MSVNLFGKRYVRFAVASITGVLAVAALSYCAFGLHLNLSATSLLFLLLVVIISLRAGFW